MGLCRDMRFSHQWAWNPLAFAAFGEQNACSLTQSSGDLGHPSAPPIISHNGQREGSHLLLIPLRIGQLFYQSCVAAQYLLWPCGSPGLGLKAKLRCEAAPAAHRFPSPWSAGFGFLLIIHQPKSQSISAKEDHHSLSSVN
jgi:hypothetical protein